jgi:hypothetical protein
MMNNFAYRDFLIFEMDFKFKIQISLYELKSRKIHWINLELWNLMKFG